MKSIATITFAIALAFNLRADELPVSTNITDVTVFLSGVTVTSKGNANLPAGNSDLVFSKLSTSINEKTIQVTCAGDITIVSVSYRINYLTSPELTKEMKRVKDSLSLMNLDLLKNLMAQSVLNGQMDLITSNKEIGGANVGVGMQNLQQIVDYYFTKMTQIKADLFVLTEREKVIREIMGRLNAQQGELNSKDNKPTGEIVVQVSTKNPTSSPFKLTYLDNQSGWTPEYDLRSDGINAPLKLTYKAMVYQNIGVDWKNVNITLSTGNPTQSAAGPVLNPWYLYYYTPQIYNYGYNAPSVNRSVAEPTTAWDGDLKNSEKINQTIADYTTVQQNQLQVNFIISLPYNIPSDGKTHMVEIQKAELKANYEYYAVPKLDADAFLIARITDWESLNLLPGTTNVFFEGTYIGQSVINPISTVDTLKFSLGRDKKIIIKRDKLKEFCKKSFFGDKTKQQLKFEFTIRNTRSDDITIRILDQLPISNNGDITVEDTDYGDAILKPETGELTWIKKVKSGEEQKFRFGFSVRYPKDKMVQGLL